MTFRGLIQVSSIFRRQLHVISSSTTKIKPASPTPSNLKRYTLPLHDRMVPDLYMPMILFYDHSTRQPTANATTISNLIKKSLSETLSKYYPLAGRLCSGSYIDCNDEGVHFVEARIGCKLSEVLEKAPDKNGGLGHLFPLGSIWDKVSDQYSSLVVQLNHFECGGIAIAASFSHVIGDASTFVSFLNYWASLSRNSGDHEKLLHLCPRFMYELLPESYEYNDSITASGSSYPKKHWITKEIVFHNTNIAKLKASLEIQDKLDGVKDQKYSRNEVLTALLYRCAVAAVARSNSGVYAKSVLFQMVNTRPMIDPPLPTTIIGNLHTLNHIPTSMESETKLYRLVARMRKGKAQLRGIKSLDGYEVTPILQEYSKNNYRFFGVSSLCNLPLYDGMDFGWGRPVKATIVDTPLNDFFILMDTPSGDGIKAIASMEEQDMENFRADKELLTYASV